MVLSSKPKNRQRMLAIAARVKPISIREPMRIVSIAWLLNDPVVANHNYAQWTTGSSFFHVTSDRSVTVVCMIFSQNHHPFRSLTTNSTCAVAGSCPTRHRQQDQPSASEQETLHWVDQRKPILIHSIHILAHGQRLSCWLWENMGISSRYGRPTARMMILG